MDVNAPGSGTKDDPWILKTPPGSSEYGMWLDESGDEPVIQCVVGSTKLGYLQRGLEDCAAMLKAHGDWMPLGSKDEKQEAKEGTIEAWARDPMNPVGGWYGIREGYRGRFANYMPPLMEAMGLVELEHNARNNRMKAH